MGKHFGKCALCGKECELTFEHIPPRAAFNKMPARSVNGETILMRKNRLPWDIEGLPYTSNPKGMGVYSLCSDCNTKTGVWYGKAYKYIAHTVKKALSEPVPQDVDTLLIKRTYPLRFIKQVISMFCSVNPDIDIDDLRQFVLNKELTRIDSTKYRLHMYLTISSICKRAAYTVKFLSCENKFISCALSEITVPPLGFILYFDPPEHYPLDGVDITKLSDCKYNELADFYFPLCILEVNDIFPTDYRSKDEIIQTIEENEKWKKEHDSDDNI